MKTRYRILIGVVVAGLTVAGAALLVGEKGLRSGGGWVVDRYFAHRYEGVRRVTTTALAARLQSSDPPLLFDVRTPAEYDVSHLAGARNVPPGTDIEALLADVSKDRAVVVYCSVGGRSAITDPAMTMFHSVSARGPPWSVASACW